MAKVKAMKIGLNGIYLGSLACVLLIQNARIALPFMVAMVSIFVGLSLFWKVIYYIDMNGWTEMSEFICNLKKYRLLKELTQEQLAQHVGVRRETIMRLEKGQYNPSLKLAIDISRVVEAPIEEIFIFD